MIGRMRVMIVWGIAMFSGIAMAGPADDAPFHCYLTWQNDPTTTVTVNFHTVNPHTTAELRFDRVSRNGIPATYAFSVPAETHEIPGLNALPGAQRFIHVAEMTALHPGTVYYYVAGSPDGGYTGEQSVQIPSRDIDDLRFVVGGDMGIDGFVPPLLEAAAAQSPLFGVIGGDIAYEDGNLNNWAMWDTWLTNWETQMITPQGHAIPMILAVGNHEVSGAFDQFDNPLVDAPFYFGLFAQHGHGFTEERRAYFRRDFGPDASLLILDSRHVTPIDGMQRDFIDEQLSTVTDVDLRMAAYHVPMYPSHRGYASTDSALLRQHWLPLFDEWSLDVAFEHHDHMLKRTKPLRANAPNPDGTVYIGDGCLGQAPRAGAQAIALETPEELAALGLTENYLAAWASARHFWLVDVVRDDTSEAREIEFTAIDADGAVWDEATITLDQRGVEDDDDDDNSFKCVVSLLFPAGQDTGMFSALRSLRDNRLLPTAIGAMMVDTYYRAGAPLVEWFSARPNTLDRARDLAAWTLQYWIALACLSGAMAAGYTLQTVHVFRARL